MAEVQTSPQPEPLIRVNNPRKRIASLAQGFVARASVAATIAAGLAGCNVADSATKPRPRWEIGNNAAAAALVPAAFDSLAARIVASRNLGTPSATVNSAPGSLTFTAGEGGRCAVSVTTAMSDEAGGPVVGEVPGNPLSSSLTGFEVTIAGGPKGDRTVKVTVGERPTIKVVSEPAYDTTTNRKIPSDHTYTAEPAQGEDQLTDDALAGAVDTAERMLEECGVLSRQSS